MHMAIEYRYRDIPVEVHGANDDNALMEFNAMLIAVPPELLRSDNAKDQHQQIDAPNSETSVEIGCTEEG